MNRRGFLSLLGAVPVAVVAAKVVPSAPALTAIEAAPVVVPPLAFHKDAFALVSEPLNDPSYQFRLDEGRRAITRMDVLYGYGNIRPLGGRVE